MQKQCSRDAKGLNEDPRRVSSRTSSSSNNNLLPQEVHIIKNIEQSAQEIRRIDLLFEGSDVDESNSDTSEVEDCNRSVPVQDMDDSEQEFHMSEDSGSE